MKKDKIIRESELILNPDGSVYHLKIKPEHLAKHIILVGDPLRVKMVSDFFNVIEFKGQNREFITHTGLYQGKRITVMSTGMGTDNIDIVLNELDALVNIDLKSRKYKPQQIILNIFRLGTSGSIQPNLPLNSIVVSEFGLGIDGMLYYYDFNEQPGMEDMKNAFIKYTNWNPKLPNPYIFTASPDLIDLFKGEDVYRGITVTAPGFYGPQGRMLRIPLAFPYMNDLLQSFQYKQHKILNYEMETSALYGLSDLLDHHAVTVCLAIANRKNRAINQDYHPAMKNLIEWLLNKIIELKD